MVMDGTVRRWGTDNADKPMNSLIRLNDHLGFRLFIGLIISTDIYMHHAILNRYTWIVFQALVFVLSLDWVIPQNRKYCHGFRGSLFGRSDYLNRKKFVTLFKHFNGIFSLKKFLSAKPSLAREQEFEEKEDSEESRQSLLTIFLPQSFPTRMRS